jgi:hypothetical protein
MISLVAILAAAVLFTDAVEILGERLGLGQGAVGSVLAAVGTALVSGGFIFAMLRRRSTSTPGTCWSAGASTRSFW